MNGQAFLTDTASGLLVLLITVLVVDQVVRRRQLRDRSQAIAAQAAILGGQAARASRTVIEAITGDGDRDTAVEELRTYMTMLLIAAPVLIDAAPSRAFLEDAQRLGGVLAHVVSAGRGDGEAPAGGEQRITQATQRLRTSAAPLLALLDPATRSAVTSAADTAQSVD